MPTTMPGMDLGSIAMYSSFDANGNLDRRDTSVIRAMKSVAAKPPKSEMATVLTIDRTEVGKSKIYRKSSSATRVQTGTTDGKTEEKTTRNTKTARNTQHKARNRQAK